MLIVSDAIPLPFSKLWVLFMEVSYSLHAVDAERVDDSFLLHNYGEDITQKICYGDIRIK